MEHNNNPSFFYHQYVPSYPKGLLADINGVFDLKESRGVMLDLGYGGGMATFALSKYFKKVYAWNIDPISLDIADTIVSQKKIKNIILENKNSDNLDQLDEKLRLVVIAQSMYKIDGETVFPKLYEKLEKGGGIAVIKGSYGEPDSAWQKYIQDQKDAITDRVLRKYLKPKQESLSATEDKVNKIDYSKILKTTGFKKVDEKVYKTELVRSIDDIIGWIYAFEWSSKAKFAKKAPKFENQLRNKLQEISADGNFKEEVYYTLITAKK
jgi:SAM-dependent methyltransferase